MPHRYLLDTNILSELVRHPDGLIARRIADVGEEAICTSIIVAGELGYGAARSGSERLSKRIGLILSALDILALDTPADRHYAEVRHHLAIQGTPIGPNDLLIAAQALASNLILVTANEGEFNRVPSLRVDNWLQR